MEFSCEQCGTRYSVPDEKVRGKRVRTKCRKCGAEIVVTGPGALAEPASPAKPSAPAAALPPVAAPAATVAAPAATPQRAEERWTVAVNRNDQRKMTTAEIVEGCAAGTLTDQTLVWKHGMDGWKTPFDVPALSLALGARGLTRSAGWREPGKSLPPPPLRAPSVPPPPVPPAPVAPSVPRLAGPEDALASDWDDENEATRVSEGALPFIARRLMADASAALASPASPKPAVPHVAPRPAPTPGRPALPARPAPAPATAKRDAPMAAAAGPIRPVAPVAVGPAAPTPADALAPAMPTKHEEATGKADVAALMAHVTAARSPMPSAPDPSAFSFSDEATAVIAPDRARALLDAEASKSQSEPASETPMAFAFDEESTQVIAPDRAVALLRAEADKSPGETVPTERPPASFPAVAGSSATPQATHGEKGTEPTIVVAGPKNEKLSEKTPAAPDAKKTKPAGAPIEPKKAGREPGTQLEAKDIIHGFQNEPTRVVRVKSKSSQLWIVVALALVAAAAGGFIASEVLARHHAPARPRAP